MLIARWNTLTEWDLLMESMDTRTLNCWKEPLTSSWTQTELCYGIDEILSAPGGHSRSFPLQSSLSGMDDDMYYSFGITTEGLARTHYWDVVFYQQRCFLSTLFENTHGFSMRGSQKSNSIHTEQPIARFNCALSEGRTEEQSLAIQHDGA